MASFQVGAVKRKVVERGWKIPVGNRGFGPDPSGDIEQYGTEVIF